MLFFLFLARGHFNSAETSQQSNTIMPMPDQTVPCIVFGRQVKNVLHKEMCVSARYTQTYK